MRDTASSDDFRYRAHHLGPPGSLDNANTRDQEKMCGIETAASRLAQTHLQLTVQEGDLIRA